MTRLLLLMLIAYLVWRGIESLLSQVRLSGGATARPIRPAPPIQPTPPPAGPQVVEPLVRCAGCGTHVLRSRTLTAAGGVFFCSEECRRRAAQSA
jgi:hypothetical protein